MAAIAGLPYVPDPGVHSRGIFCVEGIFFKGR